MFKDVRDRWIVCYFGLKFLDIHINLYHSRFLYRIIYFPDIKPLDTSILFHSASENCFLRFGNALTINNTIIVILFV